MESKNISILVIGGINVDFFFLDSDNINSQKEVIFSDKFVFGAGGKGRNIASMIANLQSKKQVAMIGRVSRDKFNFWKVPIEDLEKNKVDTKYINLVSFNKNTCFLGITQIGVDKKGAYKVNVFPGQNFELSDKEIVNAKNIFKIAKQNKGICIVTFEIPKKTICDSIKMANKYNLKVIVEPGGFSDTENYDLIFKEKIYLVKANYNEIDFLTSIKVKDLSSANKAAKYFLDKNVENVIITLGENGVYLINKNIQKFFSVPNLNLCKDNINSAGCGDQFLATIVTFVNEGKNLEESMNYALVAASLQFHRNGIFPVKRKELNKCIVNK